MHRLLVRLAGGIDQLRGSDCLAGKAVAYRTFGVNQALFDQERHGQSVERAIHPVAL